MGRESVTRFLFAGVCLLTALLLVPAVPACAAEPIEFSRDVRPILSDTCFTCHGPDAAERQADLRLDVETGLRRDEGEAQVVVPGRPEESLLYQRISTGDPDMRMPPADSGKTLTSSQVETIRRWIAEGAQWQGHWAYVPPKRPSVREPGRGNLTSNPIDAFVLERLAQQQLQPSPEAPRATLIRRLSFDLHGMPPTADAVNEFISDTRPDAYAQLVDRMLQSPHFGERMAQYWLDVVRYADTNGIHGDNHRDVALYRDYVIESFNENLPFDRFTLEQLAGDLLPSATWRTRIASGYNRLLMTTREGGAQPKEYLAKYAADRVRNASSAWLGSTMACCECHDHKFDPFSINDFYRFEAFFADLKETAVGVQEPTRIPSPEQTTEIEALKARRKPLQQRLETQTPELEAALAQWEHERSQWRDRWSVLEPLGATSQAGTPLVVEEDGTVAAIGDGPGNDTYELTFQTRLPGITGLRLEVRPDERLPAKGPGRAGNGNFVLNEIEILSAEKTLKVGRATATHSQDKWDVSGAVDGKPKTGWAILNQTGRENSAVFELSETLQSQDESNPPSLTVRLHQNHGGRHTLGRFRISATQQPRPVQVESLPEEIREILNIAAADRNDEQRSRLAEYYRGITPLLEETREQVRSIDAQIAAVEAAMPTMLVSMSVEPRPIRVLPRGNWLDESGEVVEPGVPEFLGALAVEGRRATRLDLARWLVAPENPLVARVFVNRLWQLTFGSGLVATPSDFGSQGAWPSHPRLLDWLAIEFVESGWDIKHMVRLIVTSRTYRQTSLADAELTQRDPFNRWLARQGRFRLNAEMVRDTALCVSGLLSPKLGGPSVRPYQPPGYWSHLNFPKREYEPSQGEDLYRRGVYTYWCRTFLHPSLLAFDAPTREECTIERSRSNTPLQALVLLNDPIYVEAARCFAERMMRDCDGNADDKIAFAYAQALTRPPRDSEVKLLRTLYTEHLRQYQQDEQAARALVETGESPVAEDLPVAELAAWTSVTRAIFNLHEFITRN